MNDRVIDEYAAYRPAAYRSNMEYESSMATDLFQLKANIASSESHNSNDTLFKIEEITEQTLPRYDVDSTCREFVDFRPKPKPKRRKQETKQPEEGASVGDTSSLDAFMGEFTVSKRVGEI